MTSIRQRTTLLLVGALTILLILGGLTIFLSIRSLLLSQFDQTLLAKAQALIVAADADDEKIEIDFDVQDFAGFGSRSQSDYFEILSPDGQILEKSPSLGRERLGLPPAGSAQSWGWIRLPDGRPGRAVEVSFTHPDDEKRKDGPLRVAVATYSGGLQKSFQAIAGILGLIGLVGLGLAVIIVRAGLKSGLRPLDVLARNVRNINAENLHERLPLHQLPRELQPISEKLNEMLARLEESFDREKRFSSHAAHELRTPLAELKVMTELVEQWPDEFNQPHAREMLRVIAEAEALLEKLSLLSRAESGPKTLVRQEFECETAISDALARLAQTAGNRGLTFSQKVDSKILHTDPTLWTAILSNLLNNATTYAKQGSAVAIEASRGHLAVSNETTDLLPEDVEHLFERFWRKSESRSDRVHSGLGLSIVQACARQLGGTCSATLKGHLLRIEIRWPQFAEGGDTTSP